MIPRLPFLNNLRLQTKSYSVMSRNWEKSKNQNGSIVRWRMTKRTEAKIAYKSCSISAGAHIQCKTTSYDMRLNSVN